MRRRRGVMRGRNAVAWLRSPGTATSAPTSRLAPSCSCPRAPWASTCTGPSPSSASPAAKSWPVTRHDLTARPGRGPGQAIVAEASAGTGSQRWKCTPSVSGGRKRDGVPTYSLAERPRWQAPHPMQGNRADQDRGQGQGPSHDQSELQPPYQGQAVRNSACALSDYKFYLFFTLTVHFGDALIVYLPRHP